MTSLLLLNVMYPCPIFYFLIKPAQLGEPKTLIEVVAAASGFLSIILLHFLRLASQLGVFQPSAID